MSVSPEHRIAVLAAIETAGNGATLTAIAHALGDEDLGDVSISEVLNALIVEGLIASSQPGGSLMQPACFALLRSH